MQVKTIRIVSLSAGTLGEDFVRHELEIGLQRLRAWGVQVQFGAYAAARPGLHRRPPRSPRRRPV